MPAKLRFVAFDPTTRHLGQCPVHRLGQLGDILPRRIASRFVSLLKNVPKHKTFELREGGLFSFSGAYKCHTTSKAGVGGVRGFN